MKKNKNPINETVTKMLEEKLASFVNQSLNQAVCLSIYQDIFSLVADLVRESDLKLTNESVNFLAQSYYDTVLINGNQELDPNIFTQRAKIENISTQELTILCVMLQGTDLGLALARVIKKRG